MGGPGKWGAGPQGPGDSGGFLLFACPCLSRGVGGVVAALKSSKYSSSRSKPDRQTMNLAGKPEAKAWQVYV